MTESWREKNNEMVVKKYVSSRLDAILGEISIQRLLFLGFSFAAGSIIPRYQFLVLYNVYDLKLVQLTLVQMQYRAKPEHDLEGAPVLWGGLSSQADWLFHLPLASAKQFPKSKGFQDKGTVAKHRKN